MTFFKNLFANVKAWIANHKTNLIAGGAGVVLGFAAGAVMV